MGIALAFDVYGTLIDTQNISIKLATIVGPKASDFSQLWRNKQLEYSFRRGLMQRYDSFAVCTAQALDYCCLYYNVLLSETQKRALLDAYAILPAFDDVKDSLQSLSDKGVPLYAFSNGPKRAVELLLKQARIQHYFLDVISVEDVHSFKPNPAVYEHLVNKTAASKASVFLVSSNPFDVIGAVSSGLKAAWVKRSPSAVFDPWGIEPTITIRSLSELLVNIKHL
ncbi:MAG: haloacid dehalogenase type II [Cellvibrionaceae bacterium]